ncbi:MAG: UMP kinase [Verrucomicrobiota bacterium]|jgi:uridylate kinase|nr:UMP kinase [Verrucomicrobiota bacterium]MDD8046607.1 UMP kinase [Verrucomicrobiota bacterium]HCF94508.1 UMP kinase [Verrucomicrobiota bacterium]
MDTGNAPVFRRIILKLSGEALQSAEHQIDPERIDGLAKELAPLVQEGVQIGIVIGAGNIFRGNSGSARGIERSTADYMGMLATVINALALQQGLERNGVTTRVLTAIEMREVAEPFIRRRALRHMEKNRVVIFAAGTGNPFFTTDTAAALRASELGAQALFKATKVDGIYSTDPIKDPSAKLYRTVSFQFCLEKEIKVMDTAAFAMCKENKIPIMVYNMNRDGALLAAVHGNQIGTLVTLQNNDPEIA